MLDGLLDGGIDIGSVEDRMLVGSMKGFAVSFTTIGRACLVGFASVVFMSCSASAEAKRMDRGFYISQSANAIG